MSVSSAMQISHNEICVQSEDCTRDPTQEKKRKKKYTCCFRLLVALLCLSFINNPIITAQFLLVLQRVVRLLDTFTSYA